ncbi:SDR family NAD(P)-dependent oxidoreductase [Halomonas sp. ATCH28]|uniref:SDR family NAD(P)-dependent oxidoreductase n=1 Tax=Halomonas gemina TaxID=2945105 RepID=A0ABT0SZ74_9GAMM|nr:SDR family NAD(P)-dependent oxidoreductase [Halomonas gemina]
MITGASSGIGRALAHALAARGQPLCLLARRPAPLAQLADQLRQQHPETPVQALAGDLTCRETRHGVVTELLDNFQQRQLSLDAFVHCAGLGTPAADLHDWQPDDLESALQLNAVVPLALIRALLPFLPAEREPARLVLVGAGIDQRVQPGTGSYGISKMALRRLFEQLTQELTPYRARVALFQPGQVDTPGLRQHIAAARRCQLPHAAYLQARLEEGSALSADQAANVLIRLLRQVPIEAFAGQEWHARQLTDEPSGGNR